MTSLDRIILVWIALALSLIALQPFAAAAGRGIQDVNIARAGDHYIGNSLPVTGR